jgi:beta-lactamase class A
MLATLEAQERREDLAAGLPDGTRVAFKNGWVPGIRHAAGIVYPADADPYTLVVCLTTPLAGAPRPADPAGVPAHDATGPDGRDAACDLVARIAAASWEQRSGRASAARPDHA